MHQSKSLVCKRQAEAGPSLWSWKPIKGDRPASSAKGGLAPPLRDSHCRPLTLFVAVLFSSVFPAFVPGLWLGPFPSLILAWCSLGPQVVCCMVGWGVGFDFFDFLWFHISFRFWVVCRFRRSFQTFSCDLRNFPFSSAHFRLFDYFFFFAGRL